MNEYEIIKKGLEKRIEVITANPSKQRFKSELTDLVCAYRELKTYIKNDPAYELKRRLFGLFLIEVIGKECEMNV